MGEFTWCVFVYVCEGCNGWDNLCVVVLDLGLFFFGLF